MQPERIPFTIAAKTKVWRLYLIQNAKANRWYVGQTSSGVARIKSHFTPGTANKILYSDVEEFGIESFRYRFLSTEYPTRNAAILAELIEIVRRDTIFPRGYNRAIETVDFMTALTWRRLREVADKSKGFVDTKPMLEVCKICNVQ